MFSAATEATVYVMDPYVNFNVTGSMSFENIVFRGEQALASYSSTATVTSPPLATIPTKLCSITAVEKCSAFATRDCLSSGEPTAETWSTNTALTMTLVTSVVDLSAGVTCADSDFAAATPPMTDEVSCTATEDTDTVESVRSCPGEPYHEDFFTFDSVTGVAYKRHKVLFNLYNWDE